MRVLAFDLDDTLLNSHKQIAPGTYRTLVNWLDRGQRIYLATSRPIRSVRRFIPSELLARVSVITLNGAVVYDLDGEIYQAARLGHEAREVIEYLKPKSSIHLTVEILGEHFASNTCLTEQQLWDIHSASLDMLIQMNKVDYERVAKIAIDGRGQRLIDELNWLRTRENLNPIPALNNTFINLVPRAMDKSGALKYLTDKHNIDISKTVVFGDDEPDLGMLKIAGLSVAMQNAIPAVKATSDITICHHDEDGIGYFIETSLNRLMPEDS